MIAGSRKEISAAVFVRAGLTVARKNDGGKTL